jgi:acyl transferase domain-containing protein
MIAVGLSEEDIATHLEEAMVKAGGRLSVGCVNAPENVTVTGDVPAIEALGQMMDDSGTFARKLQVPVAYHSHHMEDLADEYLSMIQKISSNAHEAGFANAAVMFSSVTGKRATSREVGIPEYWVDNLMSKVSFSQALFQMASYLLEERGGSNKCGKDILLEIGPHSALQRPTKDTIKEVPGAKDFDYDSTLSRDTEPSLALANAIGRLCCRGCLIDLAKVSSPNIRPTEFQPLPSLPPYPFNHSQSYWTESRISKNFRFREHARHELLGIRETDWNREYLSASACIRIDMHVSLATKVEKCHSSLRASLDT